MLYAFVIFLICLIASVGLLPLIYDYDISRNGIEIRLFRIIAVARIPIKKIKSAHIEPIAKTFFDGQHGLALRMGNRVQRKVLVIHTNGFISRWYLTPKNPEKALDMLGLPK